MWKAQGWRLFSEPEEAEVGVSPQRPGSGSRWSQAPALGRHLWSASGVSTRPAGVVGRVSRSAQHPPYDILATLPSPHVTVPAPTHTSGQQPGVCFWF